MATTKSTANRNKQGTSAKKKQGPSVMPKNFKLKEAIQNEKDYKSNIIRRDRNTRKFFELHPVSTMPRQFKIGALYLFDYFEPKTADDLEYYDAMPCAIFFGRVKTKEGKQRILGFNIHYYPPRIRFLVMDRIMSIFEPFYRKYWSKEKPQDIGYFEYKMLLGQLEKAKLAFGVRMYIPDLVGKCDLVEPQYWQKAVFTEGRFKKRTRQAIMNYWQQLIEKKKGKYTKARRKTVPMPSPPPTSPANP